MTVPKAVQEAKKYELHPKTGLPALAGSLTVVLVGVLKQTDVIDLSAFEGSLVVIITFAISYMISANKN